MSKKLPVKYNFKTIVKSLLLLRELNYDMPLAANDANVPVRLLTAWAEEYGEEIYNAHPIIITNPKEKLIATMSRQHEAVRFKAEELSERVLDIMLKRLMDDERSEEFTLRELMMIFKDTAPYLLPKFGDNGNVEASNMEATYDSFIENMFAKLNENNKKELK